MDKRAGQGQVNDVFAKDVCEEGVFAEDAGLLALDHQFCFVLYALSRKVTGLYRPLLDPLGLTYPQYLVLLVLWEAHTDGPHKASGVTIKTLCRRLLLDTGTLTPLLKRMEKEGWIVRQRSVADERTVLIGLTQKGIDFRQQAQKIPEALFCRTGGDMSSIVPLQRQLNALLQKLVAPEQGCS